VGQCDQARALAELARGSQHWCSAQPNRSHMLKMALATAAPTMPSTIFMIVPMLLFMSFSAGQPTIPPMM